MDTINYTFSQRIFRSRTSTAENGSFSRMTFWRVTGPPTVFFKSTHRRTCRPIIFWRFRTWSPVLFMFVRIACCWT